MRWLLAVLTLAAIAALGWWQLRSDERPQRPSAPTAVEEAPPATSFGPVHSRSVDPSPPPSDGVDYVGRVVDPLGQPVAGCELSLHAAPENLLTPAPAAPLDTERSGVDGRFTLAAENAVVALLVARHPRFPPLTLPLPDRHPTGIVDLGDVRLSSELGCEIHVQRTEENGPVDDADVALVPELVTAELTNDAGRTTLGRQARTDATGVAVLYGVQPGAYRLVVSATGRATVEQEYVHPAAGVPPVVTVWMPPGHTLSGRVVAPDRSGIADATVVVEARPGQPPTRARTSSTGTFSLRGLASGRARLRVEAGRFPILEQSVELPSAKDVLLVLSEGRAIAGRVVVAGTDQGIAGAHVWAVPADGFALVRGDAWIEPSDATDDAGNFRISGLPPGRFSLRASSERHVSVRSEPVEAGETGLRLELLPAAVAHGKVVGPDGRPLRDARIEVMDQDYDGSGWARLVRQAVRDRARREPVRTDVSGRFELALPGTGGAVFRLRVTSPRHATLVTEPIEAPPSERFDVGALQLTLGHTLSGRARDAEGRPVSGAVVSAEPVHVAGTPGVREGARTVADADGSFHLGPLAAGAYDVFYYLPAYGNAAAAADRQRSTRIEVVLPQDARSDLQLAPR